MFTELEILENAKKAYTTGDAIFHIEKEKCVLLVIDMQDEFVKPAWAPTWIPQATKQVSTIRRVINACRDNNVPVMYTVFSNTNNYLDRPLYGKTMPLQYPEMGHNELWFRDGNIWHELRPRDDEIVIHKPSYGAFYDTPLDSILKKMGKDTIIISGTLANICCGTTARQGYERGYKVVYGSDINSTYTDEMLENEIKILRLAFAKIRNSQEIIKIISA
jgi:nicotinamidase-related amidase